MSYEGIQSHLAEIYGLEVSAAKISLISDKLMPVITEWGSIHQSVSHQLIVMATLNGRQKIFAAEEQLRPNYVD